ncbi:hypothetical protein F5146DRAFT_314966, partial [Armillaria mellea]
MQPVPAGYPIERLTGPIIVGYLLHWGLFGTLSVQLYLYYLAFPKDKKFTKYLVYGIYITEFVQTVFVSFDSFSMFGYGFGDLEALTSVDFNWLVVPVMGGVVGFVGQGFYAYRIFLLSRSRTVPAFVACVSLANFVAAIIAGVYVFEDNDITKLNNLKTSIAIGIWCGSSALCNVVIAICMTYYLTHRNPTFRRTQIMVANLIRLTIETGSVTAVVAPLSLILLFVFPGQTFYGPPMFILPKLYANTVYMVLNSRIRIMGGRDTYTPSSDMMELSITLMMDPDPHPMQGTQRTDGVERQATVVTITKEVFSSDYEMGQTNVSHVDLCALLKLIFP